MPERSHNYALLLASSI